MHPHIYTHCLARTHTHARTHAHTHARHAHTHTRHAHTPGTHAHAAIHHAICVAPFFRVSQKICTLVSMRSSPRAMGAVCFSGQSDCPEASHLRHQGIPSSMCMPPHTYTPCVSGCARTMHVRACARREQRMMQASAKGRAHVVACACPTSGRPIRREAHA